MGILDAVRGHGQIKAVLTQALVQGRLPSQLLFVGLEGIGKKKVAWGLAELLLCQGAASEGQSVVSSAPPSVAAQSSVAAPSLVKACGLCNSCIKIKAGFHDSIFFIEPEKNLIKIERSREIQDFLSLSHDDRARIIIIDDVHCLNPQASNSLLKLLEEPPPRAYFFFITHRWTLVLPTIRSRTTKISFSPLSDQDLTHWADPHKEAHLIRLARGSVKGLLDQKEEDARVFREEAFQLFQHFFSDPQFIALGSWREQIKDKDKLILFIRYWLTSLKEYLSQAESVSRFPHLSGLVNYSNETIWSLWDKGLLLESGVLGHRDPVLLIEEWLISGLGNET